MKVKWPEGKLHSSGHCVHHSWCCKGTPRSSSSSRPGVRKIIMLIPAWKNFVLLWKHCWFLSVVAFLLSSAVCLCLSSPPRTCQCNNYRHRIKYKVFAFHDSTQEIVILIILHLPPPHKCPCSNHRLRWRTSSCNCWFRTSGSLCTPCRCCSHLNENVWISSFWTKKKLADWSLFCLKVFYLHQVHRGKQQCSYILNCCIFQTRIQFGRPN